MDGLEAVTPEVEIAYWFSSSSPPDETTLRADPSPSTTMNAACERCEDVVVYIYPPPLPPASVRTMVVPPLHTNVQTYMSTNMRFPEIGSTCAKSHEKSSLLHTLLERIRLLKHDRLWSLCQIDDTVHCEE